ncbi:TIGR02680 family protein [Actinophytocola algeriensis]|uniref:Uncharacterized protein (TIGR02680 family) n=1 Tax=Actinophytocola algeriensis TaxID=1768010 RepID=A0A7W7QCR2_9PSEU|nr:TIGR02680 family protein [Actinophytocola algeriensis]MBB4911103.1 uncharacterized protein (TIGR02680 family) [Actinophytocola algeriensis]MBE1479042.1 uncharacterized protein (TIGR02680 family) [Actinophytocola algeriensis]
MTVTELPRHTTEPPEPRAARWLPSRAGILNVWRYYDEVFEFHQGRLLLRGPNGTGKSKALELLLPFLFDANLRANRLSTFGTGERTMHWNLMGEGASGTTRVGYAWLEFHLAGEWFSCGARLQASNHTTTVHADYFTTTLRIGTPDGLSLVTEAGTPLTRNALEQALGEHGVLHPNATEYRSAVRTTLFPGLSEQRYDALITALLQLRTPKLSQRLDPSLLSTLLSRALPPLGQQEVADLAEGFERLDRQRERLAKLDDEVAAARGLAARQRTYAQRVLRAASAALISATTDLDNLTKSARRSADEHERVATDKAATETLVETLVHQEEETKARIDGLVESEAYQQGRELDQLRQRTTEAEVRATSVRADAAGKRGQAGDDAENAATAENHVAARQHTVAARADDTRQAATRARLASVHGEVAASLDTGPERSRPLLRAAVKGRLSQITAVRQALDTHEKAVDRRRQAEEDLDDARTDLTDAEENRAEAADAYEQELDRLTGALLEWAAACRELRFGDLDVFTDLVENETALVEHVESVAEAVRADLVREETVVATERTAAQAERVRLSAELDSLAGQRDLPPEAPPTRTTDRATMVGAPLWRLIRFADEVPEATQTGVEAALQSAGLLDAWVGATGAVAGNDVFAEPDAVPAAPGRSLSDVVVPEVDTPVPVAVVTRLLAAIAYGERTPDEHLVAIGADGGWRLANLRGSWRKSHAEYIGAVARERARERRARELRRLIAEADDVLSGLVTRQVAIDARRGILASERKSRPAHATTMDARDALTRAESVVGAANGAVRKRLDTLSRRESEATAALHALTVVAAEHGLPTERAALSTHEQAVDGFREQAELWLDGHRDLVAARGAARDAAQRASRSDATATQREEEAEDAESTHRRLAAKLDAIEHTVGVDYREVLADLSALRGRLSRASKEIGTARTRVTTLAERLGVLAERSKADAAARDDATAVRDTAARRFRHLATTSFPEDSAFGELDRFTATLAGSEGVRAALDTARLVAAAWPTVPHEPNNLGDALHRLSESVHECRTALSARADLDLETDEDVQVFTAMVDGVRVGAAELLTILKEDAEQSRLDITDRERQLFDQTLTGDTRRHLAARIRQAGELVDAMNARLERVRTASNVAVRLVWQIAPDLPTGTKAARDLLLKDPVRLTDADRESLHQFFRERIEQAKADDTAASWEQQLAQVFDYTAWHRFDVKVDRANGLGWQLLTKKLHGALSGGEKAIALHLPLFAAVAAHYHAVPTAPRIILLDEVFVGVDSNNRGQVFALLSALDLDLLLTSDHEWCTYPELSGVAIHQLITGDDGDDAVTTARFVWNGQDVVPDEG